MLYVDFKNNQLVIEHDAFITETPNFPTVRPIQTKYGLLVSIMLPNPLLRGHNFYNADLDSGYWENNSFMLREKEIVIIRHYRHTDGPDIFRGSHVQPDLGYPCMLQDKGYFDIITTLFTQNLLEKDEDGDFVFYERFLGKKIKATLFNIMDALDYRALKNNRGYTRRYNLQEELKKCNEGKPLEPMNDFYIELIKLSKSITNLNISLRTEVEEKPVYCMNLK